MNPGLFDDLPPARPAAQRRAEPAAPVAAAGPCTGPFVGPHRCSVGKGDASFSTDGGRTWLCRAHLPRGFFPHERVRG